LEFCFTCCSTEVNWTSCWVNCVESIGEVGSWYLSCVVSSVRNELKSSPNFALSLVAWLAPAGTGVVVGLIVGMADLARGCSPSPEQSPCRRFS